jgi:CRP/FNR family transcriptional regulator, cyclic AMP receptor protein
MLITSPHLKLDAFFSQFKPSRHKKRDLILSADSSPSSVFYIKSGYVRVFRISEQGEELSLTILKPSDFFPLTYGIHQLHSHFFLEAITPLELLKAPKEQFLSFIKSHNDIYWELTTKALIRFDGVLSRMEYLIFSNAYTKVAATILICAKRFGETLDDDTIRIRVPLTHKDIATFVGITRETTSIEMKKLEKQGFVSKHGRFMLVSKYKTLQGQVLSTTQENSPLIYSL